MLDPVDFFVVAHLLSASGTPPSDAQLRRAVSTAYHAVFPSVLQAAAKRFISPKQESSAGYALIYWSFDHRLIRTVCEALNVHMLKDSLKRQLGRNAVSPDMRNFANAFSLPQDARHLADYDPAAIFMLTDVFSLIGSANAAIEAFERVASVEQADVLALMLVKIRS